MFDGRYLSPARSPVEPLFRDGNVVRVEFDANKVTPEKEGDLPDGSGAEEGVEHSRVGLAASEYAGRN